MRGFFIHLLFAFGTSVDMAMVAGLVTEFTYIDLQSSHIDSAQSTLEALGRALSKARVEYFDGLNNI